MSSQDAYNFGFWLGNIIFLVLLALIFRFVGRWGWIGLIIRAVCALLFIFRIVALIAFINPPGT
jgi:ABC-type polysaccharide/polyol phosphate export permease